MAKIFPSIILLFSIFLTPAAAYAEEHNNQEIEYIVKYNEEIPKSLLTEETEDLADVQMSVVRAETKTEAAKLVKKLKKDAKVEYVEESVERGITGTVSVNDPYAIKQWHLPFLKFETLWQMGTPKKEIVVAVIDSGISVAHPELQGRIVDGGFNFLDNNSNIDDEHGHGTAVSGIIAALTNNGEGIAGASGNYPVKILPLKVIKTDGKGVSTDVVRAINYAIEKQVDIINLSIGSEQSSAAEEEAIKTAIQHGILVIASTGNESSSNYFYPASYQDVVAVGSINENSVVSDFSNHNNQVNLTAPGERIITLGINGKYVEASGTSFSAPIVAGAAAVIKSQHPTLTNEEIIRWLYRTSVDKGTPGHDPWYGYGVVSPTGAADFFAIDTWLKTERVPRRKVWNVQFNIRMDVGLIRPSDILVLDKDGREVDVSFSQGTNTSILIQPPVEGYSSEKQYEIYIKESVQTATGKTLKKPIRIPFYVK